MSAPPGGLAPYLGKITSGATPTDLLVTSMAAEPFFDPCVTDPPPNESLWFWTQLKYVINLLSM